MRADVPAELLARLEPAIEGLTSTHRLKGGELRFRCPAHADNQHPSADWNGEKATWVCRTCGAGGGAVNLAGLLGVELPSLEPVRRAPAPVGVKRYELRKPTGELVAVHGREDFEDGKKDLWWELPDGSRGLGGHRSDELPLYWVNGPPIGTPPGAPVFVTEGERAADSLGALGYFAVGTVCGASATPSEESLAPLLGDAKVRLWPDNDQAGWEHMERIAQRLWDMGVQDVQIVTWKSAPIKGDAADWTASADEGDFASLTFTAWEPKPVFTGKHIVINYVGNLPEPPSQEDLVELLIPAGVVTAFVADGGVGKSNLAVGLATALGADAPFAGQFAVRSGVTTAYLDWEDSRRILNRRVRQCARGLGLDEPPLKRVAHVSMRSLLSQAKDEVLEGVEMLGADFVVLDSTGMAQGASEKSAEGATLALFNALRPMEGKTILLLDHLDKASVKEGAQNAKAYGSVYKWAECRVVWGIQVIAENAAAKWLQLHQVKNNHGPKRLEPLDLVLDWAGGALTFRAPRAKVPAQQAPTYQQQELVA